LYKKPPWGVYCANSYNNGQIPDLTGKQGNAVCTDVTFVSKDGNGAINVIPVISGNTRSRIIWPDNSIQTTFTICSITRYIGTSNNTILTNNTDPLEIIHGHNAGKRGYIEYNENYINADSYKTVTDWLVACGKSSGKTPYNALIDGVPTGATFVEYGINVAINRILCINGDSINAGYNSDFELSHVLIWDQALEDDEMVTVSNVLRQYLYDGNELSQRYSFNNIPKYNAGINSIFCNILVSKPPLGIYCASFYSPGIIPDLLGGAFQATTVNVTPDIANPNTNGAIAKIPYISGSSENSIVWPANSIPTKYTICSITRYTNIDTTKRILYAKNDSNWFHGHKARRGQVFYNSVWMTPDSPTGDDASKIGVVTDWLVTCGKTGGSTPTNILLDGVPSGTNTFSGFTTPRTLAINNNTISSENSGFEFSHLLIWDQELTDAEMKAVSDVLQQYLYDGIELSERYAAYLDIATKTNTKKQFESLLYRKPPWGIYCASSYNADNYSIPDLMRNQDNALCSSTITKEDVIINGNPIPTLGSSTSNNPSILFPKGSIPKKNTVCSITRSGDSIPTYGVLTNTKFSNATKGSSTTASTSTDKFPAIYEYTVYKNSSVECTTNTRVRYTFDSSVIDYGFGGVGTDFPLRELSMNPGTIYTVYYSVHCTLKIDIVFTFQKLINPDNYEVVDTKTVNKAISHVYVGTIKINKERTGTTVIPLKAIVETTYEPAVTSLYFNVDVSGVFTGTSIENDTKYRVIITNKTITDASFTAIRTGDVVGGFAPEMIESSSIKGNISITNSNSIDGIDISSGENYASFSYIKNWYHGHANPNRGVAVYDDTNVSESTTVGNKSDWLVMCGRTSPYTSSHILADGINRSASFVSMLSDNKQIGINICNAPGFFKFSHVLIWDQELSDSEMKIVSNVLQQYLKDGRELTTEYADFFNTQYRQNDNAKFVKLMNSKPPLAVYCADSYNLSSGTIPDLYRRLSPAKCTDVTHVIVNGNGSSLRIPYLTGGSTTSKITFPVNSVPQKNTVCSITRYTSTDTTKQKRILSIPSTRTNGQPNSNVIDWIHGHHNQKRGVVYAQYNASGVWATPERSVGTITDWVVTCGKTSGSPPTNIIIDGVRSGVNATSLSTSWDMQINGTNENSDFAFSHVLIWDQELTDDEMATVSNILRQYLKDGIELNTKFPELFDIQSQFRNLLSYKQPYSIYLASSYDSNQIPDLMNKQGSAICRNVIIGSTASNTNGANASIQQLTGTAGALRSTITWPTGSCPSQFTICSLTRYTNPSNNKKRIITSATQYIGTTTPYITDFAHGHDSSGRIAYAKYGGAERTIPKTTGVTDWLVFCGSSQYAPQAHKQCFFADGVDVTNPPATLTVSVGGIQLGINTIDGSTSDFAFSSMFVWDTILSPNEMITVSRAFQNYLDDGVELSYGIETRPYNMNYNKAGTNVLLSFPSKNIRIPYTGPSNYFTKYTTPSLNLVKTNDSIENQLIPYICGDTVVTNYKINGKDIGSLFQSERLSRAARVYVWEPTGLDISNNKNSYPIWIDSVYTNQSVNAETLYFYTVYNSPSALSGCYVKYYIDNTIGYIKINDQPRNVDLADKFISSGSMALSDDASNKFSLTQGPNYISIKAINNHGPGYVQVDFYDSTNKFLFGTNADTWYASRTEYTTNIP
jgi:hypothetical protein